MVDSINQNSNMTSDNLKELLKNVEEINGDVIIKNNQLLIS